MRKFIFAFFALFILKTALYADELECREIIGNPTEQECKSANTYKCYWNGNNNKCLECPENQYPNSDRTGCASRSAVCHQYTTQNSCDRKNYCDWYSDAPDYKCDAPFDGEYYTNMHNESKKCIKTTISTMFNLGVLDENEHIDPPQGSVYTYMYDGMAHICQWKAKCPPGTEYSNQTKKEYSYFEHSCATCGDNEYSIGEEIKFYDNGYINTNTNDYTGCKQCPDGLSANTTKTGCICTNKTLYFDPESGTCKDCAQGFIANENGTGCVKAEKCDYGEYFNTQSWECQECQGNTFQPYTTQTPLQCWPCPENSFVDEAHVFCTCDAGYFTNEAYNNKKIDYKGFFTDVFKHIGSKYIELDIPIPEKCEQSIAIINQEEFNTYYNYGEYNNCHSGGYYWSGPKTLLPDDDYYDPKEPGADNGTNPYCDTKCEAGYYCTAIPSEQTTISKEENKHKCPEGYTSDLGSDELTDCYQICTAGQYATTKTTTIDEFNVDLRSCADCPEHFTSEAGAKSTTDCYMKPDTQFCDKDNNCQTLAQIFGNDAKFYYHD